jgi:hypothetical protein
MMPPPHIMMIIPNMLCPGVLCPVLCCCVVLLLPDGPSGLHRYKLRLLFDAVSMRWDWPVDVNYHEAQVRSAFILPWWRNAVVV